MKERSEKNVLIWSSVTVVSRPINFKYGEWNLRLLFTSSAGDICLEARGRDGIFN